MVYAGEDDISSMERGPLPPTFTSVYRLFLRASSAAVLHHKVATRHLRLLWRPTFREAARVIRTLQDPALGADERAHRERWLARWDTTGESFHPRSPPPPPPPCPTISCRATHRSCN